MSDVEYDVLPSGLSMIYGMAGGSDAHNSVAWDAVAREINKQLSAGRDEALREAAAVCRERFGNFNARAENQAPGSYPQSLAYAQRDAAKECEYLILNLLITEPTDV